MNPVELSAEDFLDEIHLAPRWSIVQDILHGYFQIFVFYSFGTYAYLSTNITNMTTEESGTFYRDLTEIINSPKIREAKI